MGYSQIRSIAGNSSLPSTLAEYLNETNLSYGAYLFPSRKGENQPLSTTQAHRILQGIAETLYIDNFGSHSSRKNWGYFAYKKTKKSPSLWKHITIQEKKLLKHSTKGSR